MRSSTLRRVGTALAAGGLALTTLSGVLAVAAAAATPTDGATATATQPAARTTGTPVAGATPSADPSAPDGSEPTSTPEPTVTPTATPAPTETPTPTPTATGPAASLPDDFPATSSTTTVAWSSVAGHDASDASYDALRGLTVTVNQTKDVTNQGLTIAWSGAPATSRGRFASNYLQVMQCWGGSGGPSPEQCQWGAPASGLSGLLGDRVAGRTLRSGEDPAQQYTSDYLVPPPLTNPNLKAYAVPFEPVDGTRAWDVSPYFTSATTNELTALRTGDDGTGTTVFTTQTSLEAPQLGCGDRQKDGTGRSCWLVVVPRTATDADGTPVAETADGSLSGSPLSASAWRDRVQFHLGFQPVGSSCSIGADEERLVGHELVADAITSWQPALCTTGTTYGFSQIGDDEGRNQITSAIDGSSRLAVVQNPLTSAEAAGTVVRYAPLAQSALVVAYNIDTYDSLGSAGASRNGTPVTGLTLNARLLAKLLTQSYRADVPGGGGKAVAKNPRSIVNDPEFVALNPQFADFVPSSGPDGLMVSLGSSDASAQLWAWIKADPHAAAFLRGSPDDWGMVVNPSYLSLDIADDASIDSYPKADLTTYRQDDSVPAPGYGTLDMRPYTNDMREAAMRAQRADAGGKTVWDPTRLPPAFMSSGAQLPGQRFELALTDLSSAERYGLRTAQLVNAAGDPVAATATTVRAAIAAMPESGDAPGVKVADPDHRVLGAYPLATVSYAAVAVCLATPDERRDYATFLRLATTTGQVTGDAQGRLPRGYVPLDAADAKRTQDLASTLGSATSTAALCRGGAGSDHGSGGTGTGSGDGSGGTGTSTPGGSDDGGGAGGGESSPGTGTGAGIGTTGGAPTAAGGSAPDPDGATGARAGGPRAAAAGAGTTTPRVTPASVTAFRLGLAGCLGIGVPSALAGPLLVRRASVLDARALLEEELL
ncbi:hypothetical protein [Luteimicrobium sp. DT211]|uniref:hypothetical protein n=1 Tax=Luteimicrobium sp. DT211 TaxID=3393412 RepID=UPI003CF6A8A3